MQNNGMSLEDFKGIFWWEWGHRQLGRVIGLVWAVGFVGFLAARRIPRGWTRASDVDRGAGRSAGGDRLVDGVVRV